MRIGREPQGGTRESGPSSSYIIWDDISGAGAD